MQINGCVDGWSSFQLPDRHAHAIQVWTVTLDRTAEELRREFDALSNDERERAARFHFDVHRRRFVAARAALRAALGGVAGIPPADVRFSYGANGKPSIANPRCDGLRFNLSHCDDVALVAVTRDREIGIDVERIRAVPDLKHIVKGFFTPGEQRAIQAHGCERLSAFFWHWTLKEAWLKAMGVGLSGSAQDIQITAAADGSPVLRRNGANEGGRHLSRIGACHLHSWRPGPESIAGLAVVSTR